MPSVCTAFHSLTHTFPHLHHVLHTTYLVVVSSHTFPFGICHFVALPTNFVAFTVHLIHLVGINHRILVFRFTLMYWLRRYAHGSFTSLVGGSRTRTAFCTARSHVLIPLTLALCLCLLRWVLHTVYTRLRLHTPLIRTVPLFCTHCVTRTDVFTFSPTHILASSRHASYRTEHRNAAFVCCRSTRTPLMRFASLGLWCASLPRRTLPSIPNERARSLGTGTPVLPSILCAPRAAGVAYLFQPPFPYGA